MNTKIHLENAYFPWIKTDINNNTCWMKGNLFYNHKILDCAGVASLFSSVKHTPNSLKDLVRNFYGCFALVIETPDVIFAAVDPIRSIPLFYHISDSFFLLSDNPDQLQKELPVTFSQESAVEFLCSGFVSGKNTLLNEIKQIATGEFIILNKKKEKLSSQRYFWNNYNNSLGNGQVDIDNNPLGNGQVDLVDNLDTVLNNCFHRCIQSTINEGKKIVVPLSGGLDSRIIVSMLKRCGINDVICFTYGKNNNYQSKISKKIAETLHYEWHNIEYNRNNWNDCFKSQEMISYLDYSHNLVSTPPLQDFLAVKILKEKGILPENSVFLPGHGIFRKNVFIKDFVREHASEREIPEAEVIKTIIKKHYNFWNINGTDNVIPDRLSKNIGLLPFNSLDSSVYALDSFNIIERQAKFIVNSVRIYEYFGYEWRLPLFDRELIDFYLKVPLNQKYQKEILKWWYNKNFTHLYQIPCTTHSSYRKPILYFIRDTLIKQFSSFFCNTKKVRCGNFPLEGFYSKLIVKRSDFGELEKLSPVISIIANNIMKKNELTFNGNQTAKFLIPFVEHLDDYIRIENR